MSQSRYHPEDTAEHTLPTGKKVVFLRRRLLPQPESLAGLREHLVREAWKRLDGIASLELQDPELYWQICDANRALRPDDLEIPGKRLRITLPAGIPAPKD